MNVSTKDGDFEQQTVQEIEQLIRNSAASSPDDIWISGKDNYPCLSILITGNLANVNYFLNDCGEVWVSEGDGTYDKDLSVRVDSVDYSMGADTIISVEQAIECMKQFCMDIYTMPNCIKWMEL